MVHLDGKLVIDKPDQVRLYYDMVIKNISEAKAQLSALLAEVQKGREILIGKAGKPIAKLIPYSGSIRARVPGKLKGKIVIAPDFDSLPEDLAKSFGITTD